MMYLQGVIETQPRQIINPYGFDALTFTCDKNHIQKIENLGHANCVVVHYFETTAKTTHFTRLT